MANQLIQQAYEKQKNPLKNYPDNPPRPNMRGPRSDALVTAGKYIDYVVPGVGSALEKIGWGNKLGASDYAAAGIGGALAVTPVGKSAGKGATQAVKKVASHYVNPFDTPVDLARRDFMHKAAVAPVAAAAEWGMKSAANRLTMATRPATAITPDAAKDFRFVSGLLNYSSADKVFHSKTMSSPNAWFHKLAEDLPMNRRDSVKHIVAGSALLPSGVAPFKRFHRWAKAIPAEAPRNPFPQNVLPNLTGSKPNVKIVFSVNNAPRQMIQAPRTYGMMPNAAAMALAAKIGQSMNTPLTRRDMTKGILAGLLAPL